MTTTPSQIPLPTRLGVHNNGTTCSRIHQPNETWIDQPVYKLVDEDGKILCSELTKASVNAEWMSIDVEDTIAKMTRDERKDAYRTLRSEIQQLRQDMPHGRDLGTGEALREARAKQHAAIGLLEDEVNLIRQAQRKAYRS